MTSGTALAVSSTLVLHECRGLKKRDNEIGERFIRIEKLPEDHPSGLRFEVTVVHPHTVQHSEGSVGRPTSHQEPEIVCRTNDEAHAKRMYHGYAKVLGGAAPDSFDPKPGVPSDPGKRFVPREDYDALAAQVAGLQDAVELLTKKK